MNRDWERRHPCRHVPVLARKFAGRDAGAPSMATGSWPRCAILESSKLSLNPCGCQIKEPIMLPQTQANQAATGLDSEFQYEANDRWAKLPSGWGWTEVAAVASDSQDRVFVFSRGEHPVMIFDRHGTFLGAWGEG